MKHGIFNLHIYFSSLQVSWMNEKFHNKRHETIICYKGRLPLYYTYIHHVNHKKKSPLFSDKQTSNQQRYLRRSLHTQTTKPRQHGIQRNHWVGAPPWATRLATNQPHHTLPSLHCHCGRYSDVPRKRRKPRHINIHCGVGWQDWDCHHAKA